MEKTGHVIITTWRKKTLYRKTEQVLTTVGGENFLWKDGPMYAWFGLKWRAVVYYKK